jgi:phosphoribosylanthranilate isomerase
VTLVKICGLREPDQAAAIARLGVDAIGVIGVPDSPRYVRPGLRVPLFQAVAAVRPDCRRVLVLADSGEEELEELAGAGGPGVLQLHGEESPERCRQLRQRFGGELWKAFRIRSAADLERIIPYQDVVDALLLDAWCADRLGGTGRRLPLAWLGNFSPSLPWWLAGGLSPESLVEVLANVRPTGVDVSSGVEDAPGVKNLARVQELLEVLGRA